MMKSRRRQATDSQVKKMSTVVFLFFVNGSGSDRCGSGWKITASTSLLERNNFCDFDKPRKHACQNRKIESNEQSNEGGQPKWVCGKGRDERLSQKLQKLIVARIVWEPGLGLLNPFEMDWERNKIWSRVGCPGQKQTWQGERMELDLRRVDGIE